MLPSFLRDSLWTAHREPQLQAHSSHTCQSPLPQSVLTPLSFVHGISSSQWALHISDHVLPSREPFLWCVEHLLGWPESQLHSMVENWVLALLIHCLTQTSIHLISFIFGYYLLQEKRRLMLIVVFFHRSQQGGFSSTILSKSVVPQETSLSHLEICGPGVWQLSTFT